MNTTKEDELQYVLRHYAEDKFDADHAWQQISRMTGRQKTFTLRRLAIAASLTLLVSFATAAGYWFTTHRQEAVQRVEAVTAPVTHYRILRAENNIVILKYKNEPIANVLDELSEHYRKSITTPQSSRRISGEIEATSLNEVIKILETTLDIKIEVSDATGSK